MTIKNVEQTLSNGITIVTDFHANTSTVCSPDGDYCVSYAIDDKAAIANEIKFLVHNLRLSA